MRVYLRSILIVLAWAYGFLAFESANAAPGNNAFAYVSPQYIITVEFSGPHSFVANFINLSDFVIVVQPSDFIYKGAS